MLPDLSPAPLPPLPLTHPCPQHTLVTPLLTPPLTHTHPALSPRLDDQWHHVAVTWSYEDGRVHLYLDGQQKTAFWKNSGGILDDKPAREGGVDPTLTPRTTRAQTGSLVLGQVSVCVRVCWEGKRRQQQQQQG